MVERDHASRTQQKSAADGGLTYRTSPRPLSSGPVLYRDFSSHKTCGETIGQEKNLLVSQTSGNLKGAESAQGTRAYCVCPPGDPVKVRVSEQSRGALPIGQPHLISTFSIRIIAKGLLHSLMANSP